jgi:hypothetical protein
LQYRQAGVKEALDVSSSGRGFQQMLLIFAYLYSHKGSVLLVDEPDAHLEILRQKQVYVLLRDIAADNGSQVVMVTHSEVILDEALHHNNLTLLLEGRAENLAKTQRIKDSLKQFGAEHYIKARERGYVLYVEGGTDVDMLRALAERLGHPVAQRWDERVNSFYVQNNHPNPSLDAELERVEGGFGGSPQQHFNRLRNLLPELRGLAILDNDSGNRQSTLDDPLKIAYWKRYEAENYFVTPDLLRSYAVSQYPTDDLFAQQTQTAVDEELDALVLEQVFDGARADFEAWRHANPELSHVLWEAKTERRKLSTFAEAFFRRLAERLGGDLLLRKGELHRLIRGVQPAALSAEVKEKLDLLWEIFPVTADAETAEDGPIDRRVHGGEPSQ